MKRNGGEEKEGNTYRETDKSLRSWYAGGTARTLISRHTGISFQTYGPLTRYTDRSRNSRWSYKSFVTWPSFRAFATVLSCDMFNFCVEKKKKTCIILLLLQQSSSLPQAFFFFFLPGSPRSPLYPFSPFSCILYCEDIPRSPFAPLSPGGPLSPGMPGEPGSPFKNSIGVDASSPFSPGIPFIPG